MPVYDYQCKKCDLISEHFYKMAEKPQTLNCVCGGEAVPLYTIGGVRGDELPSWFNEHARGCCQSAGDRPITSRTEYRNHLKAKGIIEHSASREF